MTNQAHLVRPLDGGGSNQRATPRTDDIECGLGTLQIIVARINTLTQT